VAVQLGRQDGRSSPLPAGWRLVVEEVLKLGEPVTALSPSALPGLLLAGAGAGLAAYRLARFCCAAPSQTAFLVLLFFKLPHLLLKTSALDGQTRQSDIARDCFMPRINHPGQLVCVYVNPCGLVWGVQVRRRVPAPDGGGNGSSGSSVVGAALRGSGASGRADEDEVSSHPAGELSGFLRASAPHCSAAALLAAGEVDSPQGNSQEGLAPHLMHTDSVLCAGCSYSTSTPRSPAVLGTAVHEDSCFPDAAHCGYKLRYTHRPNCMPAEKIRHRQRLYLGFC